MQITNLDHTGRGKWIAGYWLKKRLGLAEFDLVEAIKEGSFHPRDEEGQPLDPDKALAFWIQECAVNGQLTGLRYVDLALFSMAEVEAYEEAHGGSLSPEEAQSVQGEALSATDTAEPEPGQLEESPKAFAECLLSQGVDEDQVMVALVGRYEKMPQWKAAALALRRPVVGIDQFERDRLKKTFQRRTKKHR